MCARNLSVLLWVQADESLQAQTREYTPVLNAAVQIGGYDNDDSLYLTTPRGTDVENPVPMIFDRNGTAVWVANSTYSNAFDMNTGYYNGSQYVHHSLDTSPN